MKTRSGPTGARHTPLYFRAAASPLGFAPWIVYWILLGDVPFRTAVLVKLAVAVLSAVTGRLPKSPGKTLEIGALVTFSVLTV